MNKYSPYYDADEGRTTMTIDATGSWVHIKEVEKLQEENNEMRELLRAVARACRGLEAPTDAALSVLGNVLVRRDEARAEVEKLRDMLNRILGDEGPDIDAYLDGHTPLVTEDT